MGTPGSPEEIRHRASAAWLDDARADLASARSLSAHRDEGTAPFAAAFHAQQAVEKAVKALLIWDGVDVPTRHDLSLLVSLLPEGTATGELPIASLAVYAVEQRYVAGAASPMSLNERPTWDDADEAIATAENAVSVVSADLTAAGRDGEPG